MLRDDEIYYPMATGGLQADQNPIDWESGRGNGDIRHDTQTNERTYLNDDFDDVFGSAPPSPTRRSLDDPDTSPDSPSHSAETTWPGRVGNTEPSDIPRLREKHETEGYRDGITSGKGKSVQEGFDEGYGLGAGLGLRIGELLGILEGIHAALVAARSVSGEEVGGEVSGEIEEWARQRVRVGGLYHTAREELGTKSVFSSEYWGEDGIWKFHVPGEEVEGKEVLFPDVIEAHPLVGKWKDIVDRELRTWGLDRRVLDGEHTEEEPALEGPREKSKHAQPTKEAAVESVPEGLGKIMGVSKRELNW